MHVYLVPTVGFNVEKFRSKITVQYFCYKMSKKSCPFLYSEYTMKNGQDSLGMPYLCYVFTVSICPKRLDSFHIVSYYINLVNTYWTYSICTYYLLSTVFVILHPLLCKVHNINACLINMKIKLLILLFLEHKEPKPIFKLLYNVHFNVISQFGENSTIKYDRITAAINIYPSSSSNNG